MRLPYACDGRHLLRMLGEALHKENQQFKARSYKQTSSNKNEEVGCMERNQVAQWLYQLNHKFEFYPETFFLATALLDKFLHSVKARPKYLKCIGVACFYLAAKTLEEDEVVPGTLELVRGSQCGCSVAEVLRMERTILDKLSWEIRLVTPLEFLHIFHALLMSNVPHLLDKFTHMTPSRQIALLTRKLETCAMKHDMLLFSPSTVALSILSLELEMFASNWFTITNMMQRMIQIPDEDLIRCRETASHYLTFSTYSRQEGGLGTCLGQTAAQQNKPTKRKVDEAEDEDDIYDGIKRLYNDEPCEQTSVTLATCGSEARHEDSTSVSALQAVAN